jgi:uncharacterized protein YqeY
VDYRNEIRKEYIPMNKYETIKADMIAALKSGDKLRRLTLADMVAAIDKAATSGKTRVEITDVLVDEVMTKYKKTIQEMVDTCPDNEKYAEKKAEYLTKLAIATEYAPTIIDSVDEIAKMINMWGISNAVSITSGNKNIIMKMIMPWLKQNHCDMRAAQEALRLAMSHGDACIKLQMGE